MERSKQSQRDGEHDEISSLAELINEDGAFASEQPKYRAAKEQPFNREHEPRDGQMSPPLPEFPGERFEAWQVKARKNSHRVLAVGLSLHLFQLAKSAQPSAFSYRLF